MRRIFLILAEKIMVKGNIANHIFKYKESSMIFIGRILLDLFYKNSLKLKQKMIL